MLHVCLLLQIKSLYLLTYLVTYILSHLVFRVWYVVCHYADAIPSLSVFPLLLIIITSCFSFYIYMYFISHQVQQYNTAVKII